MKGYLSYLFILLVIPASALAQIDSTAADSIPLARDSLITAQNDTLFTDTTESLLRIRRWVYHSPLGAQLAATDSTLRWNIWPSWVYKKNRDPGAISYRMGSIGRTNSFSIYAHQPKYLELNWGDIRMNDPVTGTVNWNAIPLHKIERIYEEDNGLNYRTDIYLREYNLTKPLTKLNYTESKFQFRNLEFMVSRNIGRRTNAEISYWYRRGGGEYDNSEIQGNQIYARISHHLDDRRKLKLTFLNNSYKNDLPFGYAIDDMRTFNFNRFQANPVEANAQADRASTILSLNYYRRSADTTSNADNLHAGIFMQNAKRTAQYSADTTFYKVQSLGTNVRKWMRFGPIVAESSASYQYFINKDQQISNLARNTWGIFEINGKILFKPVSFLKIIGQAGYKMRSDDYNEYLAGGRAVFSILNKAKFTAAFSAGTRMPALQQLYWESEEFRGSPNLRNEDIREMHVRLESDFLQKTTIGLRAQLKQIDQSIMIGENGVFTNLNPYGSLSYTGFFDYVSARYEFSGSATYHKFGNYLRSPATSFPLNKAERIWFKGGAFVKGYLFDRATYVKAGLAGIFSPGAYRPMHYYPALDVWQAKSDDPFIPAFTRVDIDLSARVRTIMITMRMENVLDGLLQQGYFETADYPMNRRRFIFGIKVLFRN